MFWLVVLIVLIITGAYVFGFGCQHDNTGLQAAGVSALVVFGIIFFVYGLYFTNKCW